MAGAENGALRQILAVALSPEDAKGSAGDAPVVYLEGLAKELAEEGTPPQLCAATLDRAIVARLIEAPPPAYPQPPLHYLLGCYARASDALRSASGGRGDAAERARLVEVVSEARAQVVQYAVLLLSGSGVVPEPPKAAERGSAQLADALIAANGGRCEPGVVPMPPGFLEELASKCDSLDAVLKPVARELAAKVQSCSPLGDYAAPLAAVRQLVSVEPIAKALVELPSFLPDLKAYSGRALQLPGSSWLGPCFSVSVLPDPLIKQAPDILAECFANPEQRRQGEIIRTMASLRMTSKHITGELHAVVKALLGKGTREAAVAWIANALEGNAERGKMRPNVQAAASDGLFINLGAVLLQLCAPFLDPSAPLFWKRVDVRYLSQGRLSFAEDTKLAASADEERAWREEASKSAADPPAPAPEFHFVCEAFFMALKALHLGLVRLPDKRDNYARELQHMMRETAAMEGALHGLPAHQQAVASAELARHKAYVGMLQGHLLALETVLQDETLLGEVIAMYRLLAAWLLRLVAPDGRPALPLPEQVPREFATLPEWFVEDMAEALLSASRYAPHTLATARLDDMMLVLVTFIGSPKHIRSPYLRSKLSEVIHAWLPQADVNPGFRRGQSAGRQAQQDAALAALFEAHPLVCEHLVPSLLGLYSDIEYTERAGQFYIKFNMRQYLGDILAYAWRLQPHRDSWKRFALSGDDWPYLRFTNMLIADATYLLDESLKYIKSNREIEQLMADAAAWSALGPREQREKRAALEENGAHLRSLLALSGGPIRTLEYTSADPDLVRVYLCDEMVGRMADTLNYFLIYLTGPKRRDLKVKDPERFDFDPKKLLTQICSLYCNLSRADRAGAFARSIADDARSYRGGMFPEASLVLRQFGLMPEGEVQQLDLLAARVAQASARAQARDDPLADPPDEFLDPVVYTLMRDPVVSPASGTTYDRAVIRRHLLTDLRDPLNREALSPYDLRPDAALKARIDAWVAERTAAAGSGGGGGGGAAAAAMETG
ncbi:ubiquitin conjugation factor E4-like [Raphidocelis subcapitata]|uniref:RING-type E3 ubiquitin transferase n=1 Tax=Raphidocelis subcapitata TaxID=307507 RepID=A0A2V0PGF4_9CHLO|nr:ubiquitin conjugation factor E4-like [Raphidocelis subcapitata]|eukprot:GBF98629.1 ubiquitin conjugation factor E4-like [Raphidocelis subcapitata]